jgi:hypothetical protein
MGTWDGALFSPVYSQGNHAVELKALRGRGLLLQYQLAGFPKAKKDLPQDKDPGTDRKAFRRAVVLQAIQKTPDFFPCVPWNDVHGIPLFQVYLEH